MKKVTTNKLSLNKQTVTNLGDVKGGQVYSRPVSRTTTDPKKIFLSCQSCDKTGCAC